MGQIRILVTGASGLLGRALMRRFASMPDVEVLGTGFSRAVPPLLRLDVRNDGEVRGIFKSFKPDIVIHAAAERRPDKVEKDPEAATALNVASTLLLASLCSEQGKRIVFISTDYVFDGINPPFFPDSVPNPLNLYGCMKLEGEQALAAVGGHWSVLRIPMLYGPTADLGESPVTEILLRLMTKRTGVSPLKVDDWATRYPAHVEDVARAVGVLCMTGATGIFHFASIDAITKYRMTLLMSEIARISPECIVPDPEPSGLAPRPKNCRLDDSSLKALGFSPRIDFMTGIHKVLNSAGILANK